MVAISKKRDHLILLLFLSGCLCHPEIEEDLEEGTLAVGFGGA